MEWTVSTDEQGLRLDKFLAGPERLGSRRRASVALDRGKVFLNAVEAPKDAAATRLAAGRFRHPDAVQADGVVTAAIE